jgi:hypothetical protein
MWHVWPMYAEGAHQGPPGTLSEATAAIDDVVDFIKAHSR